MGRSRTADPIQEYKYQVQIRKYPGSGSDGELGDGNIGFSNVTGLEGDLEVAEYREGGYNRTYKLPGRGDFGPATFERGATENTAVFEWFKEALDGCGPRTDVHVRELDCNGNVVKTWVLYEAWARRFQAGDKDASSSEVSVEIVEVEFEDMDVRT